MCVCVVRYGTVWYLHMTLTLWVSVPYAAAAVTSMVECVARESVCAVCVAVGLREVYGNKLVRGVCGSRLVRGVGF